MADNKNVPAGTTNPTVKTVETEVKDEPLFAMEASEMLIGGTRGGGQKIRPNVGYTLVGKPTTTDMPLQERTLIVLIHKNLTKKNPVISEPQLLAVLQEAKDRGELKTRQDPWRIFQYYRANLIERKIVAERPFVVAVAAAAPAAVAAPAVAAATPSA